VKFEQAQSIFSKASNLALTELDQAKISSPIVIDRPEGYSFPGFNSLLVSASLNGWVEDGFSDAQTSISQAKATSEALERLVFRVFTDTNHLSDTSNGWACHPCLNEAFLNAALELIERDVTLSTWENGGPFYEIPRTLWPVEVIEWLRIRPTKLEFQHLKILLSHNANGSAISALLFNDSGNFVAGHSTNLILKNAILSATVECLRAAHSALRFEFFSDVLNLHKKSIETIKTPPGAHSLAYAYSESIPFCIKFDKATEEECMKVWKYHQLKTQNLAVDEFETNIFSINEHFVVRLRNSKYRNMFWGRSKIGRKIFNNNPHFVG